MHFFFNNKLENIMKKKQIHRLNKAMLTSGEGEGGQERFRGRGVTGSNY